MIWDFLEFVNSKSRKAKKHLQVLKDILRLSDFNVVDMTEESDPYIFVKTPNDNLSFGGVRVYEIGGEIAYRAQNELSTEPFGCAFLLPVNKIYEDLIGEDDSKEKEKSAEKLAEEISKELKLFFKKNVEAEKRDVKRDPIGTINARSGGTDYASSILN